MSNEEANKIDQKTVEQTLITFLIGMKSTLEKAKTLVNDFGFLHLGNSLQTSITDIDIYLNEYHKQKKEKK